MGLPGSIEELQGVLAAHQYVAGRALATAIYLGLRLGRPLLLEGEAGVGKTEVAKVLAAALDRDLIRLQCYEGLDVHTAVYEWDYARQLLQIRLLEAAGQVGTAGQVETAQQALFGPAFLLKRPLLQALEANARGAPVLLIDEIDRADEEFEAFLLEVLADFQVSVPELGTIRAPEPPVVVITSNRTREIHDALKRRCFYHWIDYPDFAQELAIVQVRAPEAAEALARQVVAFVQAVRREELYKAPGVAETLDWLAALGALGQRSLAESVVAESGVAGPVVADTLGTLLKVREDVARVAAVLPVLAAQAAQAAQAE